MLSPPPPTRQDTHKCNGCSSFFSNNHWVIVLGGECFGFQPLQKCVCVCCAGYVPLMAICVRTFSFVHNFSLLDLSHGTSQPNQTLKKKHSEHYSSQTISDLRPTFPFQPDLPDHTPPPSVTRSLGDKNGERVLTGPAAFPGFPLSLLFRLRTLFYNPVNMK